MLEYTTRRRKGNVAIRLNHSQVAKLLLQWVEVLEWSGLLDVLQGSGEVLELEVDGLLGGLGVLDGLSLEGIDGLQLSADIVGNGLEGVESLLDLVDDGLVLEDGSILGEVDGGGLLLELLDLAADVLVALLEGLQGGNSLATETEGAGDLGPVKLESCASLLAGLAVVVTRVVLSVLRSELGSSSLLSSGVDVLNLSLTEDTGSKVRRESQTVFVRLAYMDAGEVQLLKGLASLLLVAVVDHSRASGELALADLLNLGVVAGVILVLLDGGLLGLLIGKFFNAGVRHFGDWCGHRCLDLGQSLALFESSLLLESENLETLEVGKSLPSLHLVPLLGPVGLLPLGVDLGLLPELSDNTSSGTAVQALNNERGEENLVEGNSLSGSGEASVRGRAVDENLWRGSISCVASIEAGNTYSLVVDDLDDRGQVASEGVVAVDNNDSANLNEAPV
ncbi:hypothetical protein HG531_005276 [Fusarium graminearum]|nr:hypothetical protein HG531_005276 [Fusarium graminearum]